MANLNAQQKKDLKKIGITAKTEDEAREKMVKFLEKEGIDDVENDPFDELYEMCEAMYEDSDDETDDLTDEIEAEEAEDELEEELEDEEDDLEEEEDDLEDELEDEIEEEEEEKPKKKKPAKKPVKKETPKKTKKVSKRLDPKNNEADAKKYDALKKAVSDLDKKSEFEFNFIANGGVTIKFLGDNSKRAFCSFDSPKVNKDTGKISARIYFPILKSEEAVRELFGDDFVIKADWSGNHLVHDVELDEFCDILKSNLKGFKAILTRLGAKDDKLGKNRKKMEDDLKSGKEDKVKAIKEKAATKKKATKPTEKAATKKIATKKATAKKTTTKKAAKK